MELVLATNNLHKVREFKQIVERIEGVDLLSLRDFSNYDSPEETGKTFEENACLKAESAVGMVGKWVLADDSGLVVPFLKGDPGVYSARYAGENCSDQDNREKLLKDLKDATGDMRAAFFECCLALKGPNCELKTVTGVCRGKILEKERGSGGFGYDPLFVKDGYTKTFAELDEGTKNKVSHRRKALDKMLLILEAIMNK